MFFEKTDTDTSVYFRDKAIWGCGKYYRSFQGRFPVIYYGRGEKLSEVCEWYDGYRFGHQDIFNPWSVINYVDDSCYPKAFWQATGSNEIIGDILSAASPEVTENLRKLLQGEQLATYIDTDVI